MDVRKPALFVLCLAPLGALVWSGLTGGLGANPAEAVIRWGGDWALRLLLVTLAVTPFRRLTGWGGVMRYRRMLGLFAFFYACLHLLAYLTLEVTFNMGALWADLVKRPYITLGMTAFLLLVPPAVTSTNRVIRRLNGRHWRRLHRLVYPAAGVGILHFFLLVKADWREPAIYALVFALLMLARLPWPERRSLPPSL